jgi:putative alpha-1,2-mannosidase
MTMRQAVGLEASIYNARGQAFRGALACALALCFLRFVQPAFAADPAKYCNAVQNQTGFIRYPLGTIGAWSTSSGEMADVMTRTPRIYPCINAPAIRGDKEDWRASITGDPSVLEIHYRSNSPARGSATAISVTTNVTVFQIRFPKESQTNFVVIDLSKTKLDAWARLNNWTNRQLQRLDTRTFRASIGRTGREGAYYLIQFSEPCLASGELVETNAAAGAQTFNTDPRMFVSVKGPAVTVAVAESFLGFEQAAASLAAEFSSFADVQRRCHAAWEQVLNRVEIEGTANSKRMAYTALYTLYANIINGGEGSCYRQYTPHPTSVASSAYWQFIGGYQSCCWDNIRATYPFLALAFPEVTTDILDTYLARYQRDGCLDGDICLFSGPSAHKNIRFVPVLVAEAREAGVRYDYAKIYAALKNNFENDDFTPPTLRTLGHMIQPDSGGFACSRSLEFHTGFYGMAMLSAAEGDAARSAEYLRLSKAYTNLWDQSNHVFRVKNSQGEWGPVEMQKMTWNPNPQGLFEGTSRDWMFGVPHDPYGLMKLPGQEDFTGRLIEYCTNGCWFNDYQTCYPYMLYYCDKANAAQQLIRTSWVPMFETGVMYEGMRPKVPHNGWQTHYTGNSGWLLCAMLGLYPAPTPPGQFIISSPCIDKAVIKGHDKPIVIQARNNSPENIYIQSVKLDGKPYPCYFIPARRLATGAQIEIELGNNPARSLGALYLSSTDGFVLSAELSSASRLKCVIESPVATGPATTEIHSDQRPARIFANGKPQTNWSYDQTRQIATVQTAGTAALEIEL